MEGGRGGGPGRKVERAQNYYKALRFPITAPRTISAYQLPSIHQVLSEEIIFSLKVDIFQNKGDFV